MPPGYTISPRFRWSSSSHLTLLPLGPPGEEYPARCLERLGCTLGTRPAVALSHDGPPSLGPNLAVRSQFREGPEPAHPAHCRSPQRGFLDRTNSRRSGLAVGTGLHAPKLSLVIVARTSRERRTAHSSGWLAEKTFKAVLVYVRLQTPLATAPPIAPASQSSEGRCGVLAG
jgi:hypothetical protein